MTEKVLLASCSIILLLATGVRGAEPGKISERVPDLKKRIAADYDRLDALYKHVHSHPELSLQEVQTAARLAKELRQAGFEVTEKVGGTGIVGVLKNGKGPTILVRTDIDALPIVEATGLPYASKVRARDRYGNDVGVMHACGHDINLTCWTGAARQLAALKGQWSGTLVFVGQPAEEIGAGARMMLADGLFTRFPKPDYCIALHAEARAPHGHVSYCEGQFQANVDSVDITVRGRGGHGASPHATIDPIVLAARIILDLQTIVSRETDPLEPAVVTVGSIHGGTKHNIIPSEVKLQLTVRSASDASRQKVLAAIERIAKAAAQGANAPEPLLKIDPSEFTPALANDAALTKKMAALFQEVLGPDYVRKRPGSMGGEDFSRYAREVPGFYFFVGSVDPERVAESKRPGGRPLAGGHTDGYAPVPEPTIKTGVLAMTTAVLRLLEK
jgi:hippurate hydrolase